MPAPRLDLTAADALPRQYVIDGESYELRRSWWPTLLHVDEGDRWCLPLLVWMTVDEDRAALLDRVLDRADPLDAAQLVPVARRLVEHATGWRWWEAARLIAVLSNEWRMVDAICALRGMRLRREVSRRPATALNVVYWLIVEHMEEKERADVDNRLSRPPTGMTRAATRDQAADAAAFEAAFARDG